MRVALPAFLAVLALASCVRDRGIDPPAASAEPKTAPAPEPEPEPEPPRPRPELPLGGREIFPRYRLVGFCGTPGAPALGRLTGKVASRAKSVLEYADKYAGSRPVMPVFELIAVIVQGAPGADGKWRRRVSDAVVDEYLEVARSSKGLLLLNIQPGHSDFVTEVKAFEKYLREPDVGLALDPEWAVHGKQKPGATYGYVTAGTINEVAEYVSGLIREGDLPEKALVFHQVNNRVLKDEPELKPHPGVVVIKSVDGLGPKHTKITTYKALVKTLSPHVHAGFKVFFDEDRAHGGSIMSPREVLSLVPEPEYVMYE